MDVLIVIVVIGTLYWLFNKKKNQNALPTKKKSQVFTSTLMVQPSNLTKKKSDKSADDHSPSTDPQVTSTSTDDDFASFRITFGSSSKPSSNKSTGRWVAEHESLIIQNRRMTRGFYYYGGRLNMLIGFGTEPSLVDDSLPAKPPSSIDNNTIPYSDESLGYWPSYASLSSACRGVYLDWLASDRSNPHIPIGYVFIYFAGFERRVIENVKTEDISDTEFIAIFEEVARLNKRYSDQHSFNHYSANFLEYMTLIRPQLFADNTSLKNLLPTSVKQSDLRFKYELATKVASGSAIPADLAWQWLVHSGLYNFKTPAKRCADEFKLLFNLYYKDTYPNGFTIAPNKTKLRVIYRSASRSVNHTELDINNLPDPSVLKAPVKNLIAIAEKCNEALDAYSRYLGKEGNSKDDISAILLLPKPLINEINPPVIEHFKDWANTLIQTKQGLTSTRSFWAHLKEPLPNSLSKKDNELLINLAQLAGFGIAPDQRYHQTRIKAEGNVVLFKEDHTDADNNRFDFNPITSFHQISLALRLGAMVATIDGYVDDQEVTTLKTLINNDDSLSDIEKRSLEAYLIWRLNTPANMAGLKAKIEKLDEAHITFISRFIISVALSNGKVEPSQIKQIEKLYRALGLDKSRVSSDIHHLTTTRKVAVPTNGLNTANNSHKTTSDNSINDNETSKKGFSFNAQTLALYEDETDDAKAMLANIFANDDDELDANLDHDEETLETFIESNGTESEPSSTDNILTISGLDIAHSQLYRQLITQEAWSFDEVEALCIPLNLMIHGAIETINDWAFDKVNAPVIDEDDEILIDFEIVEELDVANE